MGGLLRRWWPLLALLALLLALQSRLWLGERGLPDARSLRQSVEQQRAENARLQQRNDALSAEVEDLKSGEAAVEERARSELGMVKPGETFYRVVEPNSATSLPPPPATAPPEATPDEHAVPAAPSTAAAPPEAEAGAQDAPP